MRDQVAHVHELNTRLTTAMERYTFSELSRCDFRQNTTQPGPSGMVHPQRPHYFDNDSVSSLTDTECATTRLGKICGGAGSNHSENPSQDGAAGEAAGGVAGGAAGGTAGGAAGGAADGRRDPPPDPPASDHDNSNWRVRRRQRSINELEFARPIMMKEPKKFEGKPREDFDTWCIKVQVYIEDQPERFPKDERTIDWIGSFMEKYAASWHTQWIEGTLCGLHPKSLTSYVNALKLRFEDKEARHETYCELEKVKYDGCIPDMFTQIQIHNDKALVSGAALKKLILDRLPHMILEPMHTIDLTGKPDAKMIVIITRAGGTADEWDGAKKCLGFKKLISEVSKMVSERIPFEKMESRPFKRIFKPDVNKFQNKTFKMNHNKTGKTYAELTDKIDQSELDGR